MCDFLACSLQQEDFCNLSCPLRAAAWGAAAQLCLPWQPREVESSPAHLAGYWAILPHTRPHGSSGWWLCSAWWSSTDYWLLPQLDKLPSLLLQLKSILSSSGSQLFRHRPSQRASAWPAQPRIFRSISLLEENFIFNSQNLKSFHMEMGGLRALPACC